MNNTTKADDWTIIRKILKGIYGRADSPLIGTDLNDAAVQKKFTAGMFVGNGTLGVVAGGQKTNEQSFYFGHNDMWGSLWERRIQDGICSLGGMRISGGLSSDTGYYKMIQNILDAQIETSLKVKDTQNSDAVIDIVTWTADSDDMIVTEITNNGDNPVVLTAEIWVPETYTNADGDFDCINIYPYASGVADDSKTLWTARQVSRLEASPDAPCGAAVVVNDYTARAAVAARLIESGFTNAHTNGKGSGKGSFAIRAHETVRLIVYVRTTNGGSSDAKKIGYMKEDIKTLTENVEAALTEFNDKLSRLDADTLKDEHRQWWKDFWLASYIRIPDEALMKYYYGAQYTLGCNQRGGMKHASSMWGVLNTQDCNSWGGRYFLNYNQQAQYYGVCSSNHADAILPYSNVIAYQAPWQINNTAAFGYKGLAHTRTTSPMNLYKPQPVLRSIEPQKSITGVSGSSRDQKSNGAFAVLPMIWYYEYTMDQEYLKDVLYPQVYQLMEFYLDYSEKFTGQDWPYQDYLDTSDIWKLKDGYVYMINNSSVHESDYRDLSPGLDIASAERLVRFLLDHSPVLGVNMDKMPVWSDFLEHLCSYPEKTFAYEEYKDAHDPRIPDYGNMTVITSAYAISPFVENQHKFVIEPYDQTVELEPVFPFESKTIMDDPDMVKKGIDTLKFMNSWCDSNGTFTWNGITERFGSTTNGFCKIYPIAVRLGWDAADLIVRFKQTLMMRNFRDSNLTCYQSGGGLETIGSTEFINSMLMQSDIGRITVFPNWPEGMNAVFVRLLAKGAFEVSGEYKNSDVLFIDIKSKAGGKLHVKNPWGAFGVSVVDSSGAGMDYLTDDGYITLDTQKGETYHIVKKQGDVRVSS